MARARRWLTERGIIRPNERESAGKVMNNLLRILFKLSFSTAFLASVGLAQEAPVAGVPQLREVRGQTIFSKELPAADLTFGKDFHYVGGHRLNLYGNADAEQHLFVKAGNSGMIERFYWVQFEHFLPTNTYTYDYKLSGTMQIGDLPFVYDVKSWLDYATSNAEDPASDGAGITRLAAQQNLAFPKRAARVRMFHLPSSDRRAELMIIYGEALPVDSLVPVRKEGVELDKEAPDAAKVFVENARRDLSIRNK